MNSIDVSRWHPFRIDSLFDIKKGTRLRKADMNDGEIPFIGATAFNNGITGTVSNNSDLHPGGTITVAYNGSVGASFYQENTFWASDDINVLYPKFTMTRNVALFLCAVIRRISERYAFVDKWRKENMESDVVFLPVDDSGLPDWDYMDSFMAKKLQKSQDYLKKLQKII